ncbi:glycine cleavage system aminomethyltransferase GcvT [Candidatus Berkiella cookevillensis]|uniref:Aminomethyltransferase n=1 Tax=Candidatus Berkiella cookevillensis TaxID=437022 RepID=A0A0Q9YAP5_9GAMM|nr:glycine cleavage system aminomethyltransferase GcvT [Candidatus Berkiella cookevillensis]MCS5709559.1 glycine cleavage system aminomethyltransferase GcvT [Candidatus Berkiella cookevillensis]
MLKKTPLYESHKALGAKMVPFAGWEMPLQYTSIVDEHVKVRQSAGIFDVSHMRAVDVEGANATQFLRTLLANDIIKLTKDGTALYGCMLNEQGCILDDLITYRISENSYRIVINAATTDKDLDWMHTQALSYQVRINPRYDLAMIAIQGPQAIEKLSTILSPQLFSQVSKLNYFSACSDEHLFIARTGYTGEAGVEILLPNEQAAAFWHKLIAQDFYPIGLGARDTLRLEAGLNLYGQDMDETVTPLTSNLAWTVDFKDSNRLFIGRSALLRQKEAGITQKLVGVVLKEKGVLRPHMCVYADKEATQQIGLLTSGSFSPTLSKGIGFAQLDAWDMPYCWIEIRGKCLEAQIIKPPFVKAGKSNIGF